MKTVKVLSVYSVVYFLAFVVKTQGLSLLSSFLFLFLAVFLYCVEKKEEKNSLPLCGLAAEQAFSTLVQHDVAQLIFGLFLFLFVLSSLSVHCLVSGKTGERKKCRAGCKVPETLHPFFTGNFLPVFFDRSDFLGLHSAFYGKYTACLFLLSFKRLTLLYYSFRSRSHASSLSVQAGKKDWFIQLYKLFSVPSSADSSGFALPTYFFYFTVSVFSFFGRISSEVEEGGCSLFLFRRLLCCFDH